MSSIVTRLRPRAGSYENALDAYASGDLVLSLELLSNARAPQELLLLSRVYIRLGMLTRAMECVEDEQFKDAPHELAAEALVIRASCLNVLNRFDEASRISVEARVRSISSGVVALEAELLLVSAIGHMFQGDYSRAEDSVNSILSLNPDAPPWLSTKTYRLNLAYIRFRACDLMSGISRTRSQYEQQSQWLRQAFDEFDASELRDDFMEAAALSNFADAALGTGSSKVVSAVLERCERINWSSSLSEFEFRIFSALAEASSVTGDQLAALRFLRRCNDCAPSTALKLRATVERARILSEIGEAFSSREELDHAIKLSKSVDWANARQLDQRQLVFLAAQVAGYSASEASRLLSRYDGLKSSLLGMVSVRDDRFRAEECAARSAVFRANGDNDRAVLLLVDALELFDSVGDETKAATVAAALAELTLEPRYIQIVRDQALKKPLSILARKMERIEALILEKSF